MLYAFLLTVVLLTSVVDAADRFGLTHSCLGANECENDRLVCIDADSTGDVCQVTCGSSDNYQSCLESILVIANTGGVQVECNSFESCRDIEIQWVNGDNLATFQALDARATIGGALHSLTCAGFYSCGGIAVEGQMQEQSVNVVSQWLCSAKGSCWYTSLRFHSVALNCSDALDSCDELALTCLSGGNCETTAVSADAANGASMTCESGVHRCECGQYFTCLGFTAAPFSTTTTTVPLTTAKEVTTTKVDTTTTEELSTTKVLTSTEKMTTTTPMPITSTADPSTTTTDDLSTSKLPATSTLKPMTTSQPTSSTPKPSSTLYTEETTSPTWSIASTATALRTTESTKTGGGNNSNGFDILLFVASVVASFTLSVFILVIGLYLWNLKKKNRAKDVLEFGREPESGWKDTGISNGGLSTDSGGAKGEQKAVELLKVTSKSIGDDFGDLLDAGYSTRKAPVRESQVKVTVLYSDNEDEDGSSELMYEPGPVTYDGF